jgi:Rps23 Pro-64 3,4-dihydroxylase Tpa1-like proline 4-hydroxylase
MINYYDNFLESHIAQLIDMQMKEVSWKYDYDSKPNGTQKHWHIFCGHNMDECNQNGYEFIVPIWEKIKNVVNVELERVYLNAHTFGIEPHIHTDDGDITMIYYPRLDWKIEWGGGTAIYNDKVTEIDRHLVNKGNRLIMFDAHLPHQAQPVNRLCFQLRTCVVFKTKLK